MCRDRECAISNVTPCVFVFKVGLSIPKKSDTKKPSVTLSPKPVETNSWCKQTSTGNPWNQKDTQANPNHWSQKSSEVKYGNLWNTDKMDAKDLLSLSEKKQKNLSDYCLHKKAVISNTIREIKKKEDVWRGS
eukprot:TRINITY_DN12579_c0_g1_i2.p1 TRINITY_DN12579_c0_g1~~TRINITY_DN12579_c0_g1_i2.p1  ORF type:complete len:133 (+),score=36.29 TRINITY_DN12579_c0_g1_i2:56-454(+)